MNQNKRHSGIDLMRVICMLMIVLYHIQGHGGLIAETSLSPVNRTLVVILQSQYQAAINGYALISGYIGFTSKHKYSSLILLWLRVLFYSVGITAVLWVFSPAAVSWTDIRSSFFPLLKGQYWYFTAYFGCFMLAPVAKACIAYLPRKRVQSLLLGSLFTFSCLPYILRSDPFITMNGNHALWLLILYMAGAYIRKYDPFSAISHTRLSVLLCFAAMLQASTCFIVPYISNLLSGKTLTQWYFIANDSPPTLLLSILLLVVFSRINFSYNGRLFSQLVSASFSVYLIHDHPLIRRRIIVPLAARLSALPSLFVIPSILTAAIIIYGICTCLDMLRERIFSLVRIRSIVVSLENKLLPSDSSLQE